MMEQKLATPTRADNHTEHDHGIVERIEEELREPVLPNDYKPLTPEKAERIWWPFVIGGFGGFAVLAAIVYALLIWWSVL